MTALQTSWFCSTRRGLHTRHKVNPKLSLFLNPLRCAIWGLCHGVRGRRIPPFLTAKHTHKLMMLYCFSNCRLLFKLNVFPQWTFSKKECAPVPLKGCVMSVCSLVHGGFIAWVDSRSKTCYWPTIEFFAVFQQFLRVYECLIQSHVKNQWFYCIRID